MRKPQVFEIYCCEANCNEKIGCYDAYRNPRRMDCVTVNKQGEIAQECDYDCPKPNSPPSHSFCDAHYHKRMQEIENHRRKRND